MDGRVHATAHLMLASIYGHLGRLEDNLEVRDKTLPEHMYMCLSLFLIFYFQRYTLRSKSIGPQRGPMKTLLSFPGEPMSEQIRVHQEVERDSGGYTSCWRGVQYYE